MAICRESEVPCPGASPPAIFAQVFAREPARATPTHVPGKSFADDDEKVPPLPPCTLMFPPLPVPRPCGQASGPAQKAQTEVQLTAELTGRRGAWMAAADPRNALPPSPPNPNPSSRPPSELTSP